MADSAEFNLFEILDLDPSANTTIILSAIASKRSWANTVSNTAPERDRNRANITKLHESEMTELCSGPGYQSSRDQRTLDDHRKQNKERRRAKDNLLKDHIEILGLRSGFAPADVKRIAALCDVSENEVEARLKKAGLKPASGKTPPAVPLPPQTDPAVAASIESALKVAGSGTLYDFLSNFVPSGQNPTTVSKVKYTAKTSSKLLEDRYNQILAAVSRLIKGTPEHSRDNAILGMVKTHLLDVAKRDLYNNYLELHPLKDLVGLIETAGSQKKSLTYQEFMFLLDKAQKLGASPSIGDAYIRNYLQNKKPNPWEILDDVSDRKIEPLPQCGYCFEFSTAASKSCTHCGKPLIIGCLGCGKAVASSIKCCPHDSCGFPIGDLPLIESKIKLTREATDGGKLDDADRILNEISRDWPTYKSVAVLKKNISDKRIERQNAQKHRVEEIARIRQLIQSQKLNAAQTSADHLGIGEPPIPPDLMDKIRRGIQEADDFVRKAQTAIGGGRPKEAIENLQSAISCCDDHPNAAKLLHSLPTPPATNAKGEITSTCIRMTWDAAVGEKGLTYQIIRKSGGKPASISDGETVGKVVACTFDDNTADIGTIWYYAIFSVRSLGGANNNVLCTAGPFQRLGIPTIIEAKAGDGVVNLHWAPPPGCLRVVVRRNPGNPAPVSGNELRDRGLTNGTKYKYELRAIYSDPLSGKEIEGHQQWVHIELIPQPLPTQIRDLRIEKNGTQIELKWTLPTVGQVEIYLVSSKPIGIVEGASVSIDTMRKVGTPVIIPGPSIATILTTPLSSGHTVAIPFSVSDSIAIVGKFAEFIDLPEVNNLKVRSASNSRLRLTWDWPPGVKKVVITSFSDIAMLSPVQTQFIEANEFVRANSEILVDANTSPAAICVQTLSSDGVVRSTGSVTRGNKDLSGRVFYHVSKPGFFSRLFGSKQTQLVLLSENCPELSNIKVIGARDRFPLNAEDGTEILSIPIIRFRDGKHSIPLNAEEIKGSLVLKLFLTDPHVANLIDLRPRGGMETVRLKK